MSTEDIVMARVHRLCFLCLSVRYYDRGWWCTAAMGIQYTLVHSSWPPAARCAPPQCRQQPDEGKGDERDVHMRALSLCNLELYVRDTVFQASIYRSMHIAIHFCGDKSKDIYTLKNHF